MPFGGFGNKTVTLRAVTKPHQTSRQSGDTPVQMVAVNGTELAVHDLGGSGEVVLFAHATGFNGCTYEPLTDRLAERFHVLAVDMRGHGWSPPAPDGDYRWTTLAEDLYEAVGQLGIAHGAIRCVGHSFGAACLLIADARHPGLIAAMYGYEPVVWRPAEVFGPDENPLIATATKRLGRFSSRGEALERFATRPPFAHVRADALASYVANGLRDAPDGDVELRCHPEIEAETYRGEHTSTTDVIAGATTPVVIGRGGDATFGDIGVPAHEALSNSKLIEYPHLGHFGPLQAPDEIATDAIAALS